VARSTPPYRGTDVPVSGLPVGRHLPFPDWWSGSPL
jgi:hypothetical protein